MHTPSVRRKTILFLSSTILLVIASFLAQLATGPARIPLSSIIEILSGKGEDPWRTIVLEIRLPRAFSGIMVGSLLGVAGLLLQLTLKNPLAEPYLLGLSGGATLGVVAALAVGLPLGYLTVPIAGALGAIAAVAAVLGISSRRGYDVYAVVLAGVAVASFSGSLVMLLYFFNMELLGYGLLWGLGSLSLVGWRELAVISASTAALLLYAFIYSRRLGMLMLPEDQAAALGVDPPKLRRNTVIVVGIAVGVVTGFTGPIGFIGLMAPHMARMVVGAEARRLLVSTIPMSAALTVISDLIVRNTPRGGELPLGTVTALIGVPFLLYLISGRRRG